MAYTPTKDGTDFLSFSSVHCSSPWYTFELIAKFHFPPIFPSSLTNFFDELIRKTFLYVAE